MCSSPQLELKRGEEEPFIFGGELSANSSEKSSSDFEQMSESGNSNAEDTKVEQAQDGRWTQEEHYCFLKAVAIYGREWKLVQTAIKTRTSAQIRSHAQKHFQKCAREEHPIQTPCVSEEAHVVLELCEKVLKTLKKKRDDYNLANNVPADDSDQEGSTENDMESINASLNSSSSSVNTSNHSVYSFAYPVGEESTVLGRDELIALEFLCCNKKDNYSPLRSKNVAPVKFNKSNCQLDSPKKPSEATIDRMDMKRPSSRVLHNFQFQESLSGFDSLYDKNKRRKL